MNRTRFNAVERAAQAPRPLELQGGFSGPRPGGGQLLALPPVQTQIVQCELIGGDPNTNGGLDSNGYQKCFVVSYDFGFTDNTNWAQARLDLSTVDNKPFDADSFVYAFQFSFTHGSPDPTDDGYLILKATIGVGGQTIRLIKSGGTGYPAITAGANIFPGHTQKSISFDDTTSTNTLSSSDDAECRLLNLFGDYIPTGKLLLGMPIQGIASSKKPHYLVQYQITIASDINFNLTSTLATTDATATASVTSYNPNTAKAPGGTITINNMAASSGYIFSGASGHKGSATLISFDRTTGDATYEIRQMECP